MSPSTREWLRALGTVGGAFALLAGVGYVYTALEPGLVEFKPIPAPDPLPPGPLPPPVVTGRITSDPVPLEIGGRYKISLTISGPLSLLASSSRVRDEADKLGFRYVIVTTGGRPASWPPMTKGDYYIEGTYQGEPGRAVVRSNLGGRVLVVDVWRD